MKIIDNILANKLVKKHIIRPLIKVIAQDGEYDCLSFYSRDLLLGA